jgi:hypothetical protein
LKLSACFALIPEPVSLQEDAMSEQLFRFAVLRAPERSSDLSPIVVHAGEQRPGDVTYLQRWAEV